MSSIVVADAGPLHYLVLIDCGEILGKLFDHVLVPFAVRDELFHHRTPQKVKDWLTRPPSWLEITSVTQAHPIRGLHKGETEALQLALERRADAVLMDDMDGRAAARRLGIPAIFTVAILELAAEKDLIELPAAIAKLKQTSIFISQAILDAALERDKERREQEKKRSLVVVSGNPSFTFLQRFTLPFGPVPDILYPALRRRVCEFNSAE